MSTNIGISNQYVKLFPDETYCTLSRKLYDKCATFVVFFTLSI